MNQNGKPKPLKLWKSAGINEKKQKIFKKKVKTEDQDKEETPKKRVSFQENDQEVHLARNNKKNLKRKNEPNAFSPNKKQKIPNSAKDSTKEKQLENVKTNTKNKNSEKKKKPDNLTRKEWKMLHLDKTSKSPKESTENKESKKTAKSQVPLTKEERKKLKFKGKGKEELFEVVKTLKMCWEELRRQDLKEEKKGQLLKQVCGLLKGHVKEFTFAHDTVRVLESVFKLGADTHRALLLDELKDDFLPLAKSKYGKFLLINVLRHGSKNQKDTIIKAFHGKIVKLIRHSQASEVVEMAFNECATNPQRFEMIQEFFGPNYKFFKITDVHSLDQLLEANPEKKSNIIQHMKEELMKVLDKTVVKHSIVHHVLWQFMKHCDPTSRSDIIESLRDIIPEILHTKDGSLVGMHCVWYGSIKDRKHIVKSMKKFVPKIATEEHGHMVLLAIFDVVDDTVLVERNIIHELCKNLVTICDNVHGRKVLIYLLSPRDSHFFHPDVIKILKGGDSNEISKKNADTRQSELKAMIADPLLKMIKSNMKELYTKNAFCLFTVTVLQHATGDKKEVFESIADILVEPYTSDNKNTHPIERGGSNYMLKQLLIQDQANSTVNCTFGEAIVSKVPKGVLATWIDCNRGAFLLVSLIETNVPAVASKIKEEMEGRKAQLKKKNFMGANVLLKKLKD